MVGRPATGKLKQLAVSIGEEQRAELEAAAAKAGHSVAEEVRRRLLRASYENTFDAQVRELADDVRQLAQEVVAQAEGPLDHSMVHKALAEAINEWLRLTPPLAVFDEEHKKFYPAVMKNKDPVTLGRTIALTLWRTRQQRADERMRKTMSSLYRPEKSGKDRKSDKPRGDKS